MELSTEDKQRIEQEAQAHAVFADQQNGDYSFDDDAYIHYKEGYEAATIYEREQQSSAIKELSEFKEAARRQSLELYKLEAERSELIEKMTELLKAFNDSDKNYADWVATKEFYSAFTGVNNLLERLNSLKK